MSTHIPYTGGFTLILLGGDRADVADAHGALREFGPVSRCLRWLASRGVKPIQQPAGDKPTATK